MRITPLFFSSRTKRGLFRVVAGFCVFCSLCAAVVGTLEGSRYYAVFWPAAVMSLLVFAAAMMTTVPEVQCPFCLKRRHQVKKLIVGPMGGICDECASLVLGIAALDYEDPKKRSTFYKMLPAALPKNMPAAVADALLRTWADDEPSAERKREAATAGIEGFHNEAAAHLFSQIPADHRTASDLTYLSVALGRLGRFDEALRVAEEALQMEQGSDDRAVRLNNAAWFALHSQPSPDPFEIEKRLLQIDEAKRLAREGEDADKNFALPHCLCTEAALAVALNDEGRATAALNELVAFGPLTGRALLVRARLEINQGKTTAAKLDLAQALKDLRPASPDAAEARRLLSKIG